MLFNRKFEIGLFRSSTFETIIFESYAEKKILEHEFWSNGTMWKHAYDCRKCEVLFESKTWINPNSISNDRSTNQPTNQSKRADRKLWQRCSKLRALVNGTEEGESGRWIVCAVAKTTVQDALQNSAKVHAMYMHLFENAKHSMNENWNEMN